MTDLYWVIFSIFICMVVPVATITYAIGLYVGSGYKDLLNKTKDEYNETK